MPNPNEPQINPKWQEGQDEEGLLKALQEIAAPMPPPPNFIGAQDNAAMPPWAMKKNIKYEDIIVPLEYKIHKEPEAAMKPIHKLSKSQIEERDSDPTTRASLLGTTFNKSTEAEWTKFDDIWVHASEMNLFHESFRQCHLTKKWCKRREMGVLKSKKINTDAWLFLPNGNEPEGYERCPINGYFWPSDEMVDSPSPEIYKRISQQGLVSHFIKDDYSGELFYCGHKIRVNGSDGIKWISLKTYEKGIFVTCSNCENVWPKQKVCIRKDLGPGYGNNAYCPSCYSKILCENIILPHNHNGYPKAVYPVHKVRRLDHERRKIIWAHEEDQPRWRRLMGVELELEVSNAQKDNLRIKMALALLNHLGRDFILIKHDGSIAGTGGQAGDDRGGQYGFEVVSAPAHLDYHREKWATIEQTPGFKTLRSWDTKYCGFHVHISREALSNLQIGRILAFVNHPANADFIKKIAGRGPQKYAVIKPKRLTDSLIDEGKSDETRRVAVNLTNEKTIEFRMFRGTVRGVHIIRNLEFCDALCDYCYPATRSLQDMFNWKSFVEFVVNEKRYFKEHNTDCWPILSGWLRQSEMAPARKLKKGTKAPSFIEPGEDAEPAKVIKSDFDPRLKEKLKDKPNLILIEKDEEGDE